MTDELADVVLDRIDEGCVLLDDDGIVASNPAARSLLGIDDATTPTIASLPGPVRDFLEGAGATAAEPADGEGSSTGVLEVPGADGPRHLEVEVASVDAGSFGGRLLLVRDVSDRVQQDRYRGILEGSDDAVYALDPDGRYTYTNRANTELLGYGRSELIGTHVSDIVDDDDVERIEAVIGELLEEGGSGRVVVEHDVIASDGDRVPVENHVSLLLDDDGEFRGTAGVVRDVTERKERQEQLERYERIVETMGDGVYAMDAAGRYTLANEQMLELNGYDREGVLGSGPDLVHDEADIERIEAAIRELVAEDRPGVRTVEATLETAGGEEVPIEVNHTILTDDGGEFRGTVGVVRAVTDRKERERELEEYETLLEVMPDTVVVTDNEGRIVDLHGFEGWTGYERDELIGADVSITTSEESIEEAEAMFAELLRDDDLETVTYETDVVTRDGERVPHENNMALLPADEDGVIPGSMSVLRDVTDRKERERAMRTLHDATREMVVAGSKEAVATVAYEAAADVLGLTRTGVHFRHGGEDALVPVGWTGLLEEELGEPPALGPGSLAWSVFEGGEALRVRDLEEHDDVYNPDTPFRSEMILPLGEHGVALFASTEPDAFDDDDQRFAEVLCSNATAAMDRIGREEALRERERELERQNERLDSFASTLSHDLRNPLNIAQARVQMARQSEEVDPLESADDALDRANELVEDLLALAREGRTIARIGPVQLEAVATEAWGNVETHDASLAVEADRTIEADRGRLRELLENLFRNAVEHAGRDVAVRLGTVEGERVAGDAPPAAFYVEDDGPGIPPGEREAVLERGVTGSDDGTGFGLAIVDDIAAAHGWSVDVTEGSAGGARFEFVLPGGDEPGSRAR